MLVYKNTMKYLKNTPKAQTTLVGRRLGSFLSSGLFLVVVAIQVVAVVAVVVVVARTRTRTHPHPQPVAIPKWIAL